VEDGRFLQMFLPFSQLTEPPERLGQPEMGFGIERTEVQALLEISHRLGVLASCQGLLG
jgi:hypothetical protein